MNIKSFIKVRTSHDTYSVQDAVRGTISVREFIELLEEKCDDLDETILFWNDNGYTMGYIDEDTLGRGKVDMDEEE